MGFTAHDAVIVAVDGYMLSRPGMPDIEAFRAGLPEQWRPLVIGPVPTPVEDWLIYAFLPDGSKEGWPESDEGDSYRAKFIAMFAGACGPADMITMRWGGDLRGMTVGLPGPT